MTELLDRIRSATGPDRALDGEIWKLLTEKPGDVWVQHGFNDDIWHLQDPEDTIAYEPPPRLTSDVSAVLRLLKRSLPGWSWRLASCSVSDDAWVIPDFNDPVHGERFKSTFPEEAMMDPVEWFGTDVDRRPAGQEALALCEAMLIAWEKRNG